VYSSDLYSLGLTAIYLLTGKMPEQLEADPRTGEIVWRQYALSISPSFAAVLDKAIQPWARDRFSTAREMLEALQFGANAIPPTMPPPLPSVVSAQPISAYAQPPTEVSKLPSGGYVQPPQPVAYPAPIPPSTTTTGLGDWQKAVIMGGVIGACVVGGLFVTRQPSPSTQASSQQSVAQQNISPDPAASDSADSSSPTFVQPQVPSNSAPVPVVAEVPSQTQYSPPPSSISQEEAVGLIDAWLQAKQVMFAPPYDRQVAAEITTGEQYDKAVGLNGTIDWLENNNAYYRYGIQKIEGVDQFVANANQATIQVRVTEDRTLYRNGKVDPNETDFKTRTVRYNLQLTYGQWKIANYRILN
jgi:serine/threonine-protein kinase